MVTNRRGFVDPQLKKITEFSTEYKKQLDDSRYGARHTESLPPMRKC